MRPENTPLRWSLAVSAAVIIHLLLVVAYATGLDRFGGAQEGRGGIEVGLGLLGESGESQASSDASDLGQEVRETSVREQPAEATPAEPSEPETTPPQPELNPLQPEPQPPSPEPVQQVTQVKVQAEAREETAQDQSLEPGAEETAPESESEPSALAASGGVIGGQDTVTQRRQSSGTSDSPQAGGSKGRQAAYQAMLAAKLNQYKHYPMAARRARVEGTTTLSLRILRDGTVADFHISESSGSEALDTAVLRMLERAQPLPPFPASMTEKEVRVSLRVPFSLNPL